MVLLIAACQKRVDVINQPSSLSQKRLEVSEIKQWVDKTIPTLADQPTLLYSLAQQTTLNGTHFVRIPTTGKGSDGGSFYFNRKADGGVEVNYVISRIVDSIKGNGIVGLVNLDEKTFRVNVYQNNRLVFYKNVPDSTLLFNEAFLTSTPQIKKYDAGCEVEEVTSILLPDGRDTVITIKKLGGGPNIKCPNDPTKGKKKSWWQTLLDTLEDILEGIGSIFGNGGGGGSSIGGGGSGGGNFTPYNPSSGSPIYGFDFWSFIGSGYNNLGPGGGYGVGIGGGGGGSSIGGGGSQNGPFDPWGPFPILGGMVGVNDLKDGDFEILQQIQREDVEADAAYLNNPCGSTLRYGNLAWKGPLEHVMIQLDYIYQNQMYGQREYKIPFSGYGGQRPGYADIANILTNEIFEIKPNIQQRIDEGIAEVENYVTKANMYCPIINASISPIWRKGIAYQPRYLNYPKDPTLSIVSELRAPGVIVYNLVSRNPLTQPIVIPQDIAKKLKDFLQEAAKNLNDLTPEKIMLFLKNNPDIVIYIKSAAVGAGVAIIVGTIVEDFLTAGAGISDDTQCFLLGYKLIRIAWAL